jgi:energy-coupling factor transporter transmembrane protein EcfT
MKRFHLIVGLAVVIIFLLTGQYMEYLHNRQLPDGQRMLYRSRHIYLLLAGLLNLVIGIYLTARQGWRRTLQIVGSLLIVFAPGPLLAGFFSEPDKGPEQTMLAPLGIFAVALGTLFHLISSLRNNEGSANGGGQAQ